MQEPTEPLLTYTSFCSMVNDAELSKENKPSASVLVALYQLYSNTFEEARNIADMEYDSTLVRLINDLFMCQAKCATIAANYERISEQKIQSNIVPAEAKLRDNLFLDIGDKALKFLRQVKQIDISTYLKNTVVWKNRITAKQNVVIFPLIREH